MAKTIEQLKAQSAEVKNATVEGENTATRVGTLFNDIVEHVEDYEAKQAERDTKQDNDTASLVSAETARAKAAEEANTAAIEAEVEKLSELEIKVLSTGKIVNSKNLLLFASKIDNAYYYTSEVESESYCYFIVPIISGQTYIISNGARFISKNGINIVNDVQVNYTYISDFTGDLYITYLYTQEIPWVVCKGSDDITSIGGYNTPSLSEDILSQTLGYSKTKIVSQKAITEKINPLELITKKNKGSIKIQENSISNAVKVTPSFSIKTDYNIIASFEAASLTQVQIGKGYYNPMFGSYLNITPRQWAVYINGQERSVLRDIDYDLKPEFYKVYIKVGNNHKATIRISYPGDAYTFNDVDWFADGNNEAFIWSSGTINNVLFTLQMRKSERNIYMFGDSYFHIDDSTTWMWWYLQEYNNALISGFGGATTEDAYRSWDNLQLLNKPRYCILCTGMNDDTDTNGVPSSKWTTWKDYFINSCIANGVEPILATIPTVPTINHEAKNEWVRNSGYRYIDFATAVGAKANGVWYDNMLGNDGIHPTVRGAQALFFQAITDVPELIWD